MLISPEINLNISKIALQFFYTYCTIQQSWPTIVKAVFLVQSRDNWVMKQNVLHISRKSVLPYQFVIPLLKIQKYGEKQEAKDMSEKLYFCIKRWKSCSNSSP